MSNITFHLNGQVIEGWQSVSVIKSMIEIVGAYGMSSGDYTPKGLVNYDNFKLDDEVVIKADDKKLLTGYIDDINYDYGKDYATFELLGRDKPCDLVDCMWDGSVMEWKKQTVINLIRNLCSPFGISVTLDSNVSSRANQVIETFTADFGRYVYEYITELCREHGLIAIVYNDGKLHITETTTTRKAHDKLEVGKNILSGSIRCSNRDRYSTYKVKGSGIGTDDKSLADFIEPTGYSTDSVISRSRSKIMIAETPCNSAQCLKKAQAERNYQGGMSRELLYELNSWTQSNGDLWEINMLAQVEDSNAGINKEMLIYLIEYDISSGDSGEEESVILHLVDKDTFTTNTGKNIKMGFDR